MKDTTVTLTEDQALFIQDILKTYLKEHAVTNHERGILNRAYKQLAQAKTQS